VYQGVLFESTVKEKQEKHEADNSLRASPRVFLFLSFYTMTTAQIIASSTDMRYSAGDSDVCVKMTLRTHF